MSIRDWSHDDIEMSVEIRGVYDGWSWAILKDGRAVNRWNEVDYPRRYAATQPQVDEYNRGEGDMARIMRERAAQ